MKINKNTWHYKLWKKSFLEGAEPAETDLCRYCHKVFWQVLGIVVFGAMILGGIAWLLFLFFYQGLWLHPLTTLIVVAAIAAIVTVVACYNRWMNAPVRPTKERGLVGSWVSARKRSVCPLVQFSSESEDECCPKDCCDDDDEW